MMAASPPDIAAAQFQEERLADRLTGRMTTDYFSFFCPSCGYEIDHLVQTHDEGTRCQYTAECKCGENFWFKMSVWTSALRDPDKAQ
jgi:hypothetical protein